MADNVRNPDQPEFLNEKDEAKDRSGKEANEDSNPDKERREDQTVDRAIANTFQH